MAISIFWHRRDLRLEDNAGLFQALKSSQPVLCLFIFDKVILDKLEDSDDRRLTFIYRNLERVKATLEEHGSSLLVKYGEPLEVWKDVLKDYEVKEVFTNRDYEPYATKRDGKIGALLEEHGIAFHQFKDQCLREKNEVLKSDGTPYVVYSPYSKRWLSTAPDDLFDSFDTTQHFDNFHKVATGFEMPSFEEMGFKPHPDTDFPAKGFALETIKNYADNRNFPAKNGTTRLSVHLRFGTISIRQLARETKDVSSTFLNELIWRDFYMMILTHFPYVAERSFRPEYDYIEWRNDESDFMAWCEGKTGYPMVDAGMRELNETGFMHNRVRMVVASFLTKHLLIDWRWGEAYFARKLMDFELASNNGGWQWAAGSGCDAAPYFRVFNPSSQLKKFDPKFAYVKQWVPEYGDFSYPQPIVDHKMARERALETYKAGLKHGKLQLEVG